MASRLHIATDNLLACTQAIERSVPHLRASGLIFRIGIAILLSDGWQGSHGDCCRVHCPPQGKTAIGNPVDDALADSRSL